MTAFDPTHFNFTRLRDFKIAGDVPVYEYNNHPAVDGMKDFLRLNVYLAMDGNYVTIWHGLLEPMFTEAECSEGRLASVEKPVEIDFFNLYNEDLFRGYIDSDEDARCIVKALRIGENGRYALPQVLSRGANNKLRCDLMEKVE